MIRKTVAKAFRGEHAPRQRSARVPDDTLHRAALERLQKDLVRALESMIAGLGPGVRAPAGGDGAPFRGAFTVSKPRPLAEGLGVFIEGKGASIRLLDTLAGFLRVTIDPSGAAAAGMTPAAELLSVQLRGEEYWPVLKPEPSSALARSIRGRISFRFLSVAELARRYARAAADPDAAWSLCRPSRRIDSAGKVP